MSIVFNYGSLISLDNLNAQLNVEPATALPQSHVDMAVVGIADFLSGNYTQKSSDVNDIVSNFTFAASAVEGAGFYLHTGSLPTGLDLTSFGDAVHDTSDNLAITGRSNHGSHHTGDNRKWFANLQTWNGATSNVVDASNDSLKVGKTHAGIGAVLVQSASAALFKKLGKHAALANDKAIQAKQTELATSLKAGWDEVANSYDDSTIFQRYLASGRYADDSADVNAVVNYNVTGMKFDFIVQIKGNVADKDDESLAIASILGDSSAGETKVLSNGDYTFNVYMRLEHQTVA
jgi:hypothetical protein